MEKSGFLRWLAHNTPIGFLALGEGGLVTTCNPAAEKLLGLSASAVKGRPWPEILKEKSFLPEDWPEPQELPRPILWPFAAGELSILVHGTTVDSGGCRDIFYLVYPDQVWETARPPAIAREQSAATTIHEIRNPMTVIQGFMQLLEPKVPAADKGTIRMILSELDRVNRMLEDLLTFHAPSPGTLYCDASSLLPRILSLYRPMAEAKGVALKMDFLTSVDPAQVSESHFIQIIHNLLHNAIQAMPDGGMIIIRVWSSHREVFVEVEDSGEGISPEVIPRIFEPFFTTKEKGTGLGLAICQRLATDAGGGIHLTKTGPDGTTFTLRLPKASEE